MSVPCVLVIEDEERLRLNVMRGLSKLPNLEVVGAATLNDALAAIDRAPPDVILSDLDLPDRPGVELIGELGRRGLRCPVTFVSAYTRAFSAQIPRHAHVQVVDKPAPLEKLREIVRQQLAVVDAGAVGSAPFGVADYLQLACMGQHSVRISIAGDGPAPAAILVHQGVLWSARDMLGEGEQAFRRLVVARGRRVSVRAATEAPGPRDIYASWEALLLDAARSEDEAARDTAFSDGLNTGQFFSLKADDEPPSAPDQEDLFHAACEDGVASLLRRDYRSALKAFRDAQSIHPEDRTVVANLRRLSELGVGATNDHETENEGETRD